MQEPSIGRNSASYVYHPLREPSSECLDQYGCPEGASTRVLTLNPTNTSPDGRLSGTLNEVVIGSHTEYDPLWDEVQAISYTWGMDDRDHSIMIDGEELPITRNLSDLLHRLCLPTQSRMLWIDAICIDQANSGERTAQVAIMASIYHRAASVLVWLGEDTATHEARHCFAYLRWLGSSEFPWDGRASRFDSGDYKDPKLAPYAATWAATETPSEPARMTTPNISLQFPHADELNDRLDFTRLQSLLSRRWFSRRWVIQEVSVARRRTIKCGEHELTWRAFSTALTSLALMQESPLSFVMPALRLTEVTLSANLSYSPIRALENFRDFDCKDPRDRISSLRFLLFSGNKFGPMPQLALDYSRTVE